MLVFLGRTMEFAFDLTQIPIIGSKYWDIATTTSTSSAPATKLAVVATESASSAGATNCNSAGTTGSRTATSNSCSDNVSSWKRPAASQVTDWLTTLTFSSDQSSPSVYVYMLLYALCVSVFVCVQLVSAMWLYHTVDQFYSYVVLTAIKTSLAKLRKLIWAELN